MATQTSDQVRTGLSDAHAVEEQALVQLRAAPKRAGEPELAAALSAHIAETEEHERLVRGRLDAVGDSPSTIRDLLVAAAGYGFVAFARVEPDTPGKLATHAYSYEHLELGMYEILSRLADHERDGETAETARRIGDQERRMGERLQALFPRTAAASLDAVGRDNPEETLSSYLSDAHALEQQSLALLERACSVTAPGPLHGAYQSHLQQSRRHRERLADRLGQLGGSRSMVKDTAMKAGGIAWATFFKVQRGTPAKMAAFAFAFEHLEIGGYEHLRLTAEALGDADTAALASALCAEERSAARTIADHWDDAVRLVLEDQ